jgi:hypothetical protein
MLVRKYRTGNDFGCSCFSVFWEMASFGLSGLLDFAAKSNDKWRVANHPGATRKASNRPFIQPELGSVHLHSPELNSLP